MTAEEAIAIIEREIACVNKECNIERACGKCELVMPSKEPIIEAYKLAIEALEYLEEDKEIQAYREYWADKGY